MPKKKKNVYNADSITVYKGLEGVRAKPSMYIGKLGDEGLLHCLREGFENSIDEAMAGYNDYVIIKITDDSNQQTFTIIDRGRGIPISKHKKTGISTLTTVMTMLHAGGKFDNKAYQNVRGTHGLGISCLHGNSRIKLLNGTNPKIKDLVDKKNFWVWATDKKGMVVPAIASKAFVTKKVNKLIRIHLDNNTYLDCTEDHLLRIIDVDHPNQFKKRLYPFVKAEDLKCGMSLVRLAYELDKDGYMIFGYNKNRKKAHRLVAEHLGWDIKNKIVHHKNENKLNNDPLNLKKGKNNKHVLYHRTKDKILVKVNKTFSTEFQLRKISKIISRIKFEGLKVNEENFNDCRRYFAHNFPFYTQALKTCKTKKNFNNLVSQVKAKKLGKNKKNKYCIIQKSSQTYHNTNIKNIDERVRKAFLTKFIKICSIVVETGKKLNEFNYETEKAKLDNSKSYPNYTTGRKFAIFYRLNYKDVVKRSKVFNHKITKFTKLNFNKSIKVYDLTVKKYHNFFANDVCVHNCTNALSSEFEVWTYRNKTWYYQSYEFGKETSKVKKVKFPSQFKTLTLPKKGGTIIKFTPDYKTLGKAKIKTKQLDKLLSDSANLNSGLKIRLVTKKLDKTYVNKGGVKQYLKDIIERQEVNVIGKPFIFESKTLSIAIQWSDYDGENGIISYINGASTAEGGTHMQGLFDIINKTFRNFTKKKQTWTASDIRYGIIGFINFRLTNAEFDSQTKIKLVTVSAKKDVVDQLSKPFKNFLNQNRNIANEIMKRAIVIKLAKDQARALTKAASNIRKGGGKNLLLPGKLVTASSKTPPEDKELFLLEGNSASGTATDARYKDFQEVLPLRGKIINAAKKNLSLVLKSEEVQNIFTAIGINPSKFSSKKRSSNNYRIGKVILLMDSDPDGKHIEVLACTLIHMLIPELFKKKMVYSIDAPLYFANYKNKKYYGYSLKEIQKVLPTKSNNVNIIRAKGWGEIDYPLLREVAFNKDSRKMFRIKPVKGKDKTRFMKVVGEDTTIRKEILGIE